MRVQYPVLIEGGTSGFVPDLPVIVVAGAGRDEIVRLAGEAIALRAMTLSGMGRSGQHLVRSESIECEEC